MIVKNLIGFTDLEELFGGTVQYLADEGMLRNQTVVDMYTTDDSVIIKLAIPGVKVKDISLDITGDQLTLSKKTDQGDGIETGRYLLKESSSKALTRVISLPSDLDSNGANASYEDGVITVIIPKKEEVKPKYLEINYRSNDSTPAS